jgi:hypothetical protein
MLDIAQLLWHKVEKPRVTLSLPCVTRMNNSAEKKPIKNHIVNIVEHVSFLPALFIIARSWKEPRFLSTEEWIKKMSYIYTMEYYSAIKNNNIMKVFGKWMELENIILSEVTQPQKNMHGMHSLISGY